MTAIQDGGRPRGYGVGRVHGGNGKTSRATNETTEPAAGQGSISGEEAADGWHSLGERSAPYSYFFESFGLLRVDARFSLRLVDLAEREYLLLNYTPGFVRKATLE